MKIFSGFNGYAQAKSKADALDRRIKLLQVRLRVVHPALRGPIVAELTRLRGQRRQYPSRTENIQFRVSRAPVMYANNPSTAQSTWQRDITWSPSTGTAIIFGRRRPCTFQRLRNFLTSKSLGQYFNRHFRGA